MACRDIQKAEEAAQEIQKTVTSANDSEPVGQIVIKKLDLSSFTSIKQCAKDILQSEQQINLLINNAGNSTTFEFLFLFLFYHQR